MADTKEIKERKARLKHLKDTTANWERANPILLDGEMGIEDKGNGKLATKMGDGITPWNRLPYYQKPIAEVEAENERNNANLQNQIDNIVLTATGDGDAAAEVAQSRVDKNGTNHPTLKERLDYIEESTIGQAESIEWLRENGDTQKLYTLPDGAIYLWQLTEIDGYTNILTQAVNADGTAYIGNNGEVGYKTGYRLNSSRQEVEAENRCCTGYIPIKSTDVLRLYNISHNADLNLNGYIQFFDSNFTYLGCMYETAGFFDKDIVPKDVINITEKADDITYFRLSTGEIDNTSIITINEEICENGIVIGYGWAKIGKETELALQLQQEELKTLKAKGDALETETADNKEKIETLEAEIANQKSKIEELEKGNTGGNADNGEPVPLYTNLLPTAEMGSDQSTGWIEGNGYTQNARLSGSSGTVTTNYTTVAGACVSGYINVKQGDVVRIKGFHAPTGVNSYVAVYNGTTLVKSQTFATITDRESGTGELTWRAGAWYTLDTTKLDEGTATFTLDSANFGTEFNKLRFSGVITENTIITVNEEIIESGTGGSSTEDNEVDKLELIREWDAPIYDANIPVFELTTEKTAVSSTDRTPTAIYEKYDALMAKYPKYITKTNLGLCSDGVTPVFRYDFKEPEPHHSTGHLWSETKTKAILTAGIHYEWAGIYGLYYALEEIAENPELYALRRNTHFIVVPVSNPYCTLTENYEETIGVLNANGVQIHRNFEVGFIYPNQSGYVEAGNRNHGGTAPLSEVETQYLDRIMKDNPDSALLLSCHNYGVAESEWGIDFMWTSSATAYMCNMGYRLADKMSVAWMKKYGDTLSVGIADYKKEPLADGDTRLGMAHISSTNGTETRQATKYGIQGVNVEISSAFAVHGTKADPEPSLSAFTMSRGAETYINFLLTALGCYDYKDKALYT